MKFKNIEKRWNEGEKIYDEFASPFGFDFSTPSTGTLELFSILKDKGEKELLLRSMLVEFLENLSDEKIRFKNGKLYLVGEKLTEIKSRRLLNK